MSKTFGRDTILIVVVIVVFAAAYFIFQEKPVEQDTGFKHPDIPGMTTGDSPEMQQIIAELPDNYNELIKLGNNYMDQRMYAIAIESYQKGLSIDSSSADVLIDLGACYHAVGGGEKAIEYFEKALIINPNHIIGHFNSGIVYRSLGNNEMAIRHWEKVAELDPGTPMADSAKSYIEHIGHNH